MIVDLLFTYPRPWFLAIGLPLAFIVAWLALGMSVWLIIAGALILPIWLAALWCLGFVHRRL